MARVQRVRLIFLVGPEAQRTYSNLSCDNVPNNFWPPILPALNITRNCVCDVNNEQCMYSLHPKIYSAHQQILGLTKYIQKSFNDYDLKQTSLDR